MTDKRVDFAYNDAGQFETITRYSDLSGTQAVAVSDYVYDGIDRLTDLAHEDGSVTPVTIADYDWVYDAASRITSFTSSEDGTVDYTYAAAGQLTDANFPPRMANFAEGDQQLLATFLACFLVQVVFVATHTLIVSWAFFLFPSSPVIVCRS